MLPASASFQSLTAQVVARLAAEIAAGTWVGWLPGERDLTGVLRVSRKTVRKALGELTRRGVLATARGQGHRIVAPAAGRRRDTVSVGLLTLEPLERLRPFTALWIDELRALLFENDRPLALYSGHRFFSSRANRELERLVRQNPQSCWVLAHTDDRIQQWFHARGVPCVLAGSGHPGLPLPSVDLDYSAVCRHAAGLMVGRGHRRLALLVRDTQRAGDLDSAAGFLAGAARTGRRDVEAIIVRHADTAEAAHRALARIFDRPGAPTALLVAVPAFYLTVVSFLAARRLRVPHDVSLVSRDDESFLPFLTPVPARYSCRPRDYAKRLLPLVLALARGDAVPVAPQRIEPRYLPGPSLDRPGPGMQAGRPRAEAR